MTTENTYWNKDIFFTLYGGGQTLLLRENPIGWNESFIKWERSDKYYGLFRSYAQDLTFVKDGAYFLRRMFYSAYGRVGAECTLTVEKLDRTMMVKDLIFTGEVDFMTFEDSQDGVNVTIVDNGLSKWIKLNENTEYSLPLSRYFQQDFIETHYEFYDYEPYYSLFLNLLDKMTEGRITSGEFAIDPTFLADIGLKGGITTGKGVRDPLGGTNLVKVKFSDLASDFSKLYFCGFYTKRVAGVDTLFIDDLNNLYDISTEIYDLGSVSDLSISPKENLFFNRISIGYETNTYENSTVQNETNSESIFLNNRDNIGETLDLKCKYRADFSGLTQIYNQSSTDESLDNTIWHLTLESAGLGQPYQTITGRLRKGTNITAIRCKNHNISPAHLLIKWGKYIDACMDGEQGMGLILESWGTENNLNQTTNISYSTPWIAEQYPYVVTKDRLFLPYIFSFKAPAGYEFFQALNSNPLGYISFEWDRHTYKGFLLSGTVSIAEETVITFTLLSHPLNDLKNLIRR